MHRKDLEIWLEAERAGRDGEAEEALMGLFQSLPMPAASSGFAERVAIAAMAKPPAWPLWLRSGVAACLALAGLATAALPALGALAGQLWRPAEILTTAGRGLAAAAEWVAGVFTALHALLGVREAMLEIAASPPVATVLLSALLLTVLTFRALRELLAIQRNPSHV